MIKAEQICVHFQLFEIGYIKKYGEVVGQLQHSQLLENEEPDNRWLFVFNLCFGEFNFIQ